MIRGACFFLSGVAPPCFQRLKVLTPSHANRVGLAVRHKNLALVRAAALGLSTRHEKVRRDGYRRSA